MPSLYEFARQERYRDKSKVIISITHVANVDNFDNRQYVWFDIIDRVDKQYLNIFLSDSEYAWGLEKTK